MIERDEIDDTAAALEVRPVDVERDYVFGWLLAGIFGASSLRDRLVLKGGNALRKGYFENTRFSGDLDFAAFGAITPDEIATGLDEAISFARTSGVVFVAERTRVEPKQRVDKDLTVFEARVFFEDFYGKRGNVVVKVRMDFTAFERLILEPRVVSLLHPYSDAANLNATVRCVALEEILASKLKCLLQRQHAADLYDYVHWLFFEPDVSVSRTDLLSVFLRKTIYGTAPGAALDLLVRLPFAVLRTFWDEYVTCPAAASIDFEDATARFCAHLNELFAGHASRRGSLAFFPAAMRTPIMSAGRTQTLLRLRYDGVTRLVEPYSLRFKVRKDGVGFEYFYGWDQTGGRSSAPGIKQFVAGKVEEIEETATPFEPRFPVEVSKAGEPGPKRTFARAGFVPGFGARTRRAGGGLGAYVFECTRCSRHFPHVRHNASLREHHDSKGSRCYGRWGRYVGRE